VLTNCFECREYKEEWNRASGADHRGSQVEDQASVLGPVPDARLRGVVQEVALNNVFRYPWPVMKSLYHYMLDECLDKVRKTGSKDDTGIKEAIFELHELLDEFEHAPYTVQRLSEVLLEPQKQYSDVEKMLHSLYILLSVTSCHENVHRELPPLPRLGDLVSVNDNPVSPYTGQPPAPPLNAEVDNVLNGDFEEGPQVGYEQ